jgi:TPR repeat protein
MTETYSTIFTDPDLGEREGEEEEDGDNEDDEEEDEIEGDEKELGDKEEEQPQEKPRQLTVKSAIRILLDEIASKPSNHTVKICLARIDVKQVRRMAKATMALPSIQRTRKSASEWLIKWASNQRSSKILISSSHSQAEALSKAPPQQSSFLRFSGFVPRHSDLFRRAPQAMQKTAVCVADHVDRIHRQQHHQLLTYMSGFASLPADALPVIAALSPATMFSAQMQCSSAVEKLEQLIERGHLQSRADLAWILLDGREGVLKHPKRAFELVQHGANLGCLHCLGVAASCHWGGIGCEANKLLSWQMASASAAGGSRYGFWTLGVMHRLGDGGAPHDYQQALQLFNMAAVLNLDAAQFMLGYSYFYGLGIVEDHTQAMRWFNMAAAQGHPDSCYMVGRCMELANHGSIGRTNAIRWYQRAFAAGHPESAVELFGQHCS